MKTIVFLNLHVLAYHVVVFRALIKRGYHCVVYYWEESTRKTGYCVPIIEGLELHDRFDYSTTEELYAQVKAHTPVCLVSNGWSRDKGYNKVCRKFRQTGGITVVVSDTQWRGGKQWANRLLSPFRHRRWFDYIWVAGVPQYEYARKLGFPSASILMNCFSADLENFLSVPVEQKGAEYPKRMLYVGRFVPVKALDVLLAAWGSIVDKRGWTLELVGDGPLKETFRVQYPDVIIKDYMSQADLAKEVAQSGCFLLLSRFEPWALVLQEFAAAGMPIICTRVCGAARHFVLNGYNGYVVDSDDIEAAAAAMRRVMDSTTEQLMTMSRNSRALGKSVTPDLAAATLLSIL